MIGLKTHKPRNKTIIMIGLMTKHIHVCNKLILKLEDLFIDKIISQ